MSDREFNPEWYDDEFYKWHREHVHSSSVRMGAELQKILSPDSALDFGCGIGSVLDGMFREGCTTLKGYELNEHHIPYLCPIVSDDVEIRDILQPMEAENDHLWDCVLCLEVAEHIPSWGSRRLVGNLTRKVSKGGHIVFTAAGQESELNPSHINCHEMSYWLELFKFHNFYSDSFVAAQVYEAWVKIEAPEYYLKTVTVLSYVRS